MATDINTKSDDRIGGYRYIRTIHPGATSVVMEVLQEGTQRRFALKQLLASRAEDREEFKAFVHEAKLGMELRHPHLIKVIEFVKDPATKARFPANLAFGVKVGRRALQNGLLCRFDPNWIAFGPSLVSTSEQIDEMVALLDRSMGEVLAELNGQTRNGNG